LDQVLIRLTADYFVQKLVIEASVGHTEEECADKGLVEVFMGRAAHRNGCVDKGL
jgi:hypothetical protein